MPIAYIHTLLRSHEFSAAATYAENHPDEARSLNSANATPLAVLVRAMTQGTTWSALAQGNRAWARGVQEALDVLIRSHPRGVANVDKRGDTALVIACRDGRVRRADDYASRLLVWAIDRMIDVCPEAAAIPDAMGCKPIHHVAGESGFGPTPLGILKKLARAHPDPLLDTSREGYGNANPLMSMVAPIDGYEGYWDKVKPLLAVIPGDVLVGHPFVPSLVKGLWRCVDWHFKEKVVDPERTRRWTDHILSDAEMSLLASKMIRGEEEYYRKARDLFVLLLLVARHGTTDPAELPDGVIFRGLHAAAGLKIPPQVVRLAADLYPEQLGQIEEEKGWTPLHAASAGPAHKRTPLPPPEDTPMGMGLQDRGLEPTAVQILIAKYPAAARMIDKDGRFPLHLALESGKEWSDVNEAIVLQGRIGGAYTLRLTGFPSDVETLVAAAPDALRIPDKSRDGLYPFQVAAEENGASLNTVFELIRADPSMVGVAMHLGD